MTPFNTKSWIAAFMLCGVSFGHSIALTDDIATLKERLRAEIAEYNQLTKQGVVKGSPEEAKLISLQADISRLRSEIAELEKKQ